MDYVEAFSFSFLLITANSFLTKETSRAQRLLISAQDEIYELIE